MKVKLYKQDGTWYWDDDPDFFKEPPAGVITDVPDEKLKAWQKAHDDYAAMQEEIENLHDEIRFG